MSCPRHRFMSNGWRGQKISFCPPDDIPQVLTLIYSVAYHLELSHPEGLVFKFGFINRMTVNHLDNILYRPCCSLMFVLSDKLNKLLINQSRCLWFQMPWFSYDVILRAHRHTLKDYCNLNRMKTSILSFCSTPILFSKLPSWSANILQVVDIFVSLIKNGHLWHSLNRQVLDTVIYILKGIGD